MKLLVTLLAALVLVPSAGASTIYFATEHVVNPILTVRVGIDGRGATVLARGPVLAVSSRGAVATADGTSLEVNGVTVADVGWRIGDADFSPDGSELAFTVENASNCGTPDSIGCAFFEVWIVGAGGTGLRQISPNGDYPRFSPDGRKLAFARFDDIYWHAGQLAVQDLVTKQTMRLGPKVWAPPVWATGSKRLAYVNPSGRMIVVSLAPRSVRQLGPGRPQAFSPDGRTLLYSTPGGALYAGSVRVAAGLGEVSAGWSSGGWIVYTAGLGLFRVRPDGSRAGVVRMFVPTTEIDFLRIERGTVVFQQTQSRSDLATIDAIDPTARGNERRVRVDSGADSSPTVSNRGVLAYVRGGIGNACLVVGDSCVAGPSFSTGEGDIVDPAWAPDGSQLAYLTSLSWAEHDLVVVDAATKVSHVVARFGLDLRSPSWSPDGGTIFVVADGNLVSVDVATGSTTTIPTGKPVAAAQVSPDGKRIALLTGPAWGGDELEIYDTATATVTDLGRTGYAARPAWSPDGRQLAYVSGDLSIHVISADGTGDLEVAPENAPPGSSEDEVPSALAWVA